VQQAGYRRSMLANSGTVGRVVTCWLCLLYNGSCQVSWWLWVCGYLLLVARDGSVIVCWLMANWMKVVYAVFASWLFFLL